jgi:serine/threonine protein kinase
MNAARTNYGRWKIVKRLGSGGQGTVFLASDTSNTAPEGDLANALEDHLYKFTRAVNNSQRRNELAQNIVKLIRNITREDQAPLCALKEINSDPVNDAASTRLKQEVEVLKKVQHPSLIRIFDSNPEEKWFAMEYFPGGPLYDDHHDHLGGTKGDVFRALVRARPLVDAVAALHREGFVHRDIKPQNIFVADNGRLVLVSCLR